MHHKIEEYFGVDDSYQFGDTCIEVFENGKEALLKYIVIRRFN